MLRLSGVGWWLALALSCNATEMVSVQVDATLETGSQAGSKVPVTLAYDASAVPPQGEAVIPAIPLGDKLTPLQRAEAVFHEGVLESVRLFLRFEGPDSPIHNLVIGVAGPGSLTYVDQTGGVGTGSFRLIRVPNNGNLSVIRPLPEPLDFHPGVHAAPDAAHPGLQIFAPEPAGANPLNLTHPAAAPGLLVVDPAPLRLTPPPPPPPPR